MLPVEYIIELYDSTEQRIEKTYGVTLGATIAEAAANIEKFYGDELISVKLFPLEEAYVYEFGLNNGLFHVDVTEV